MSRAGGMPADRKPEPSAEGPIEPADRRPAGGGLDGEPDETAANVVDAGVPPPDRWRAIRDAFDAISALPPGERRHAASTRPELAPGERRLLAAMLARLEDAVDAPDPAAERADAPAPRGYRLVRRLGRGSFGVVHEAIQLEPRRRVALKVLAADVSQPALVQRFIEEGRALARFSHPGIVQVYEVGFVEGAIGSPFIAMELVQSPDLDTWARAPTVVEYARDARLGRPERATLVATVCDAAHTAHLHGVVHRDLKPANILVGADGQPKLVDFGVARMLMTATDRLTSPGEAIGTLVYMSPEQARGRSDLVDARADVFALGAIAFELLSPSFDRLPRGSEPEPWRRLDRHARMEALAAISSEQPEARLKAAIDDDDLRAVLGKALAGAPEDRYASARELGDDLRRWARGDPVSVRPPGTARIMLRAVRRRPAVAVAALFGIVAVAAVAAGVFALRRSGHLVADSRGEMARAAVRDAALSIERADPAGARAALDSCPPERRGIEWRVLAAALAPGDLVMTAPRKALGVMPAPVVPMAGQGFEPSPAVIVADDVGGVCGVRLDGSVAWRVESPGDPVNRVHALGDGRAMICLHESGQATRWRVDGLPARTARLAVGTDVEHCATSADGRWLATAAPSVETARMDLRLWDLDEARLVEAWSVSACTAVAFAAGAGSGAEPIVTWSIDRRLEARVFGPPRSATSIAGPALPRRVAALASGILEGEVIAADDAGNVHAWIAEAGAPAQPVGELGFEPRAIVGDGPGGAIVAAGHRDVAGVFSRGAARGEGGRRLLAGHDQPVVDAIVAADGAVLTLDGHGKVRRFGTPTVDAPLPWSGSAPGHIPGLSATTAEGPTIVAARADAAGIDPALLRRLGIGEPAGRPASTLLMALSADGADVLRCEPVAEPIVAVAVDPAGTWAAAATGAGSIVRMPLDPSLAVARLAWPREATALAADVAGGLVVGERDGSIHYRAEDGSSAIAPERHQGPVTIATVSPDGRTLATAGRDGDVLVWDLVSRRLRGRVRVNGEPGSAGWRPDGRILAIGDDDGDVAIIDVDSPAAVGMLTGHSQRVYAMRFAPDGARLLTVGADDRLRIWDLESREELLSLALPADCHAGAVIIDPRDGWIGTVGNRGVRRWMLSPTVRDTVAPAAR